MAFTISLHALLWRSVLIFEMDKCLHPESMCRALSGCWQFGHCECRDFKTECVFLNKESSRTVTVDCFFPSKRGCLTYSRRHCSCFVYHGLSFLQQVQLPVRLSALPALPQRQAKRSSKGIAINFCFWDDCFNIVWSPVVLDSVAPASPSKSVQIIAE